MRKIRRLGFLVEIDLSEWGHAEYSAWCSYRYDKKLEKYCISMWLKRRDIDDTFKIESQKIRTQYIVSTRETIEDDIHRIIKDIATSGFFDYYVERFEYTYKCCDIGEDLIQGVEVNV